MSTHAALDCIVMAGSVMLGFHAFDKKRVIARWARMSFVIFGVVGTITGFVGFAWDLGWIILTSEGCRLLGNSLIMGRGALVGLLIPLLLSQQFMREKKENQPADSDPEA